MFASCDNPTRTRLQPVADIVDPSTNNNVVGTDGGSGQETPGSTPTDPDPTIDDGFQDCNLGYQYYGGSQIGNFGLCQSTLNPSVFKVKLAKADKSLGNCFVPVHIVDGGNSFKLGIAECVHNDAGKTYDMTLTRQRPEALNGVMVIKAGSAINAYMSCMSAKVDYMRSVPNCQYSQQCMIQANNHANYICTQFVGTYSTFYRQVNL